MKNKLIIIAIILVICIFVVWFIGWETVRYDKNDKRIGKVVKFSTPMLYIEDIPKNMAGSHAAEKFGSLIRTKESWNIAKAWFPELTTKKIRCNEQFVVKHVFYTEQHGFLSRAFSPDIKSYVITSPNYKESVVYEGDYDEYAKTPTNVTTSNCATIQ